MATNEIIMNPDGLVVNAYRDAPGRGDYFNGSSGTSEGQFLFILGMLDAYVATGSSKALEMAERGLGVVLSTLYRNTPIPSQVTEQKIFAPHWLFAVKYAFKSSLIDYDRQVSFTEGVGVIPLNTVRYVWNARSLDAVMLWENPFSPLTSGTLYAVASYVYVEGVGTRVTLSTPYTGTLKVTHSTQTGPEIAVNDPYEAWPDWRKLDATEIEAACDVFIWAYRAFIRAYEVTGNQTWADAARATLEQADLSIDLNDGRDWLKPTWTSSPFADGARFSYVDRSPPPGFGVDGYGRTVIDIPQRLSGTGEVQYGRASIGDNYASGDVTTVVIESSAEVTASLYIDLYQTYSAANRYSAPLVLTGDGEQTISLTRTSFKNNAGVTLPVDAPVYKVGVTSNYVGTHTIAIKRIRQTPPRNIAYYPGAIPFTANFAGSPPMQIDWRGPIYAGYQSPPIWSLVGKDAAAATCAQLLVDAQTAWVTQTGKMRGPFAPVFYFAREDAIQYGPANTFGWEGPDPNTRWGGYQYRPLAELAESLYEAPVGSTLYTRCLQSVTDFLQFLSADRNWIPYVPAMGHAWASVIRNSSLLNFSTNEQAQAAVNAIPYHQDGPPTDFPKTGQEVNYNEPHMTALILRAFLFRDQKLRPSGGAWASWESDVFDKCYGLLKTLYVRTGVMAGTFSNSPSTHEWYGFWHGEIQTTITQLLTWSRRPATRYPNIETQALEWLHGMLDWAEANSPTGESPWGTAIWPFVPDWANGINEAFEFSTNIITSFDGSEQRIGRRPDARRSLTLRHTLLNGDQSAAYQAILRSRQNRPMLVPQWHRARTTMGASVGQTHVDLLETPDTDLKAGSVIVIAQGEANRQVNHVVSIVGNRVNLRTALSFNLNTRARICAAYMGLLNTDLSASKPTTTYLIAEVQFQMLPQEDGRTLPVRTDDRPVGFTVGMATLWSTYIRRSAMLTVQMPLYWPERGPLDTFIKTFTVGGETREVITRKPNWISEVSAADQWVYDVISYYSGPVTPGDGELVGKRTVKAQWTFLSADDADDFMSMLGRLKGTRRACWLPSWSRDFEMTRDSVTANQLFVRNNGIIAEGTLDDEAVGVCVITNAGGFLCARVTSYTTGAAESRLTLDRSLEAIPTIDHTARICLLYRVRQAADKADITWLTTNKAEASVSFITVQE